jgi:methionine sulfoxide reductase heme-binding subunit
MRKALRSWPLFWVLAFALSAVNCIKLPSTDFHSAHETEFIVLRAVLCALPFLLVAFAASSLAILWPNRVTRWILANRRYIGLAFAFGMGWHFAFVAYYMATFGNQLSPSDLTVDIIGLCVLVAMTLTSFRPVARQLSPANWRRLHKAGIYTVWALPTYFYLEDLRDKPNLFYVGMLCVLVAAFVLRVIAWRRRKILIKARTFSPDPVGVSQKSG